MTEQTTMDNGPAPRMVDETAEAWINEMYAQEIDRIRNGKTDDSQVSKPGDADCESGL